MTDARVEEIGREELRTVLKLVPNKAFWAKALKKVFKAETLPEFLASRGGKLHADGDAAAKEVAKAAGEVVSSMTGLPEGLTVEQATSVLLQVLALARVRHKDCMTRLLAAVGVKKGSPLDSEAMWAGLTLQRLGRPVPESERGADALLKAVNDGLTDPLGRRLAAVDLTKVKSVAESNAEAKPEEEDSEAKKAGKLTKQRAYRNVRIVFNTLAAASSVEIDAGADGAPRAQKGEGEVMLPGTDPSTPRVLDATLIECESAVTYLLDSSAEDTTAEQIVARFNRFWAAMTKYVSWSDKYKRCVAGAIADTKSMLDQSGEVLEQVLKEERKRKADATAPPLDLEANGPLSKKQRAAEQKRKEEKKKAEERKKKAVAKKEKRKVRLDLIDSTGEVCQRFRQDPKSCTYGDRCKHKHLNPGDDSDDEDVRKRGD